jgi:hypothetical protein
MNKRMRSLIWVCVALLVVVAVGWLLAQDDDRPPIIVTNGSMYFTNGDARIPKPPTKWAKDAFLSEWKPQDNNYKGIRGFTVSFENSYAPSVCPDASWVALPLPPQVPKTPLTGEEVHVVYTAPDGTRTTIVIHRRKSVFGGLFGKFEPKVVQPDKFRMDANAAPTRLEHDDTPGAGYISEVSVTGTTCQFPPPSAADRLTFRVWIQPNAEQ